MNDTNLLHLNRRANRLCDDLVARGDELSVAVRTCSSGARLVDCGIDVAGSLEAGRMLAEICLAGLGAASLVPGRPDVWPGLAVCVRTDQPLAACMASQYAGWQITGDSFFAMGSGPMRAARGREELFNEIGCREKAELAVGVLESAQLPPPAVCTDLAEQAGVDASRLTLAIAPTASLAGTIQIVARSVETALHKMHELRFDLLRVVSGFGTAPLAPVAKNDLAGIGRTNDAVLYGGEVTLWVTGDDESLEEIGPKIPSCGSPDFGEPFLSIFERYDRDFYRIDPLLFSPARVTLNNLETGRVLSFGDVRADILLASFVG